MQLWDELRRQSRRLAWPIYIFLAISALAIPLVSYLFLEDQKLFAVLAAILTALGSGVLTNVIEKWFRGGAISGTTNSIGMEFVLIPAGTFTVGSADLDKTASDHEKPAHQVTISQPFYMAKYEVTQAQWKAVMGSENNPSRFKGDDRPVECVSWQ